MNGRGYVCQRSTGERYVSAWRDEAGEVSIVFGGPHGHGRCPALSARYAIDFADFYMRGCDPASAIDEADAQAFMRQRMGWAV